MRLEQDQFQNALRHLAIRLENKWSGKSYILIEAVFHNPTWKFHIREIMPLGTTQENFDPLPYLVRIDDIESDNLNNIVPEIDTSGALSAIEIGNNYIKSNRETVKASLFHLVNLGSKNWYIEYLCDEGNNKLKYVSLEIRVEDSYVKYIKTIDA